MNINIQVTPWGKEEHGWEAQNRYLNVSDISVNITDFNRGQDYILFEYACCEGVAGRDCCGF